MSIPAFDYARIPAQGDPMLNAIIPGILKGMQLAYLPQQSKADLALKQSKAQQAQALANMPFGGQTLPGSAGQIMGLESVKQLFGEDSPQYKQALDAFNLSQQSAQSRINYQNILSNTLPNRALSPTGKTIVEEGNISAGLSPTGQPFINSPSASPNELSGAYQLARQKQSSDVDTRKRNLFATNIEKTLDQINVNDLTQYAGASGSAEKTANYLATPFNKESKNYDDYLKSLQGVKLLTQQVRQFYGDSIQPEMVKRLQTLNDTGTWNSNPELAKSLFNQTRNILEKELQTYRDALKGTQAYQGKSSNPQTIGTEGQQKMINFGKLTHAPGLNIGNRNVITLSLPNGTRKSGTAEQFEAFFKDHPELRVKY